MTGRATAIGAAVAGVVAFVIGLVWAASANDSNDAPSTTTIDAGTSSTVTPETSTSLDATSDSTTSTSASSPSTSSTTSTSVFIEIGPSSTSTTSTTTSTTRPGNGRILP